METMKKWSQLLLSMSIQWVLPTKQILHIKIISTEYNYPNLGGSHDVFKESMSYVIVLS